MLRSLVGSEMCIRDSTNIVARTNNTTTATPSASTVPIQSDRGMLIDWAAAAADKVSDDSTSTGGVSSATMNNIMIQPHPTSNLLFEAYSIIDISEPIEMTAGGGSAATLAVVTLQTTHGPGSFSSGAIVVVNVDTETVVSPLFKMGDGSSGSGVPVRSFVVHDRNAHTTAPFFVIVQRRNGEAALHTISLNTTSATTDGHDADGNKSSPTPPSKSAVPTFIVSPAIKIIASPQIAALTPHNHQATVGDYHGPNTLQHPHPIYTTVSGGGSGGGTFSVLQMNHNALELCHHGQVRSDHHHHVDDATEAPPPTFKSTSVFTMPFLESTTTALAQRALKYWRGNHSDDININHRDAPEHKLHIRSISCFTVIGGPTAFIAAVALDNGVVTLVGSEIAKNNSEGEGEASTTTSTTTKTSDDLQMFNQHHRKFDIHFDGTVTEPGIRYFVLPSIDVSTTTKAKSNAYGTTATIKNIQQEPMTLRSSGGSVCTCLTASIETRILALGYSCGTALLWDMSNPVSYTHLRAHETPEHLVCRLLLEKKKKNTNKSVREEVTSHRKIIKCSKKTI
eukprot:TRINITY_DN4883_c0_g1_i1.p1 TRINITY_DN4883_c0_g1~~TRINITY_DN4883_c0_g1_i1.p1  ORF type:complete len:614 (+),score=90.65 TRINITY_DN4883_c0_g1_i1:147-1844(+)